MDSIMQFLKKDTLPEERVEADKVRRKATRYWLSENQKLYKCFFSGPYLLCVHPEMTELLLEELHKEICGSHTGGRSLAHRAITKAIGGQICREKLRNMSRSATNANSLRQTYTSQGEFLIHYPAVVICSMGFRYCRSIS